MSSLRVVLGSKLTPAVRTCNGLGLRSVNVNAQKCWLSSYSLSRHFHSFHHRLSGLSGSLSSGRRGNLKVLANIPERVALLQPSTSAGFHSSTPKSRSETRIDESLNRLDIEIRKVGRIRRQEVDDILEDIKEMKKATSSQSLMLLRTCGELMSEAPPNSRTELVQQIWKTLENLKVPMDVSHYNALLRVYLENEHKFNPTEFLQDLTNKGIEPNRVTYQRLIARYCQDGDIDGASTILEHMKEKQLPINEYVFNALILGHGQANDMESAEGIIGVMKQAGLEPNDDTYVTLMTAYAKNGDISHVHRIAKECEENEIFLIDRDFLSVIFALASNNHHQLIDEVLPYLKRHSGFNQEATTLIFKLLNIGQEETAFKILKQMSPIVRQDGPMPSGNFFIKHLVQMSRPSEIIIKYSMKMQEEGLNQFAMSRACECALIEKKFDLAMELFEAAKKSGLPIRQHYFWPLFASATSDKEILFGLRYMKEFGISPSTETLRDYIIPNALGRKKDSIEVTLQKLSSATGIPLGSVVSAAMLNLLAQNEVEVAANFSTQFRLRLAANPLMRRATVDAYLRTRDASAFAKIIGSSCLDGDDAAREEVGMMLMELVDTVRGSERKAEALEPVLKQLLANGLGISNSGSELLQNHLGEALTPELANAISQLTSSELTPKISLHQDASRRGGSGGTGFAMEDKSSEELEEMLAEATRKNSPIKGIKKALLYSYCRDRNVEKLDKLKQELQQDEFVFTSGLHAMFLELYSSVGRLEEAKQSYEEILKSLDMKMDDLKILRYAAALQSSGDLERCVEVIKNSPRDESRKPTGGAQQVTVWKLLNSLAESSPDKVKEVFELLNERKLAPVNNVTLGPLVKAYLVKDDLEGALKEFERCVQEYRVTPWKQELFCRFIKLEDADRLQKVMDLSTSIHGEVNSMYDLVFAFIDCGKLRQARKILETPGLRARNDKIEMFCQRYCQENRVAELENLIEVTKDLMDVDRNSMYFYLLQAYCKSGDTDKALSVWTSMQEENVQPSVELLIYLADFLQKNNCSVPFVIPDRSEMISSSDDTQPSSSSKPTSSSTEAPMKVGLPKSLTEFRRCIDMNDIDRALQIKQRLEAEGTKLNVTDTTNLILNLARAERLNEATRLTEQLLEQGVHPFPRTLRFLFARLANAGDVNALERIGTKLNHELKRFSMFNSRLCLAYANADRGAEYFDNYIRRTVENSSGATETRDDGKATESNEDQEEIGNVPVFGTSTLLRRNENLLPDFENLASQAQGLHRRALNNALYIYFMSKKEFQRAQELWDGSLKSESRVLFRVLAMEARKNNDLELATTVNSHVLSSEGLANTAKAVACSCLVDVLVNTGKIDEALDKLDETLKTIKLEDYPVAVLSNLRDQALAANKKFPYQIPEARHRERRNRRKLQPDSSDSD